MASAVENKNRSILVGFDGFVDTIVSVVDKRSGHDFSKIHTIYDFGGRILSAAGKSSNIEIVEKTVSIGGNGPILASALLNFGEKIKYIGTLGDCANNIFKKFAKMTSAVSIGDYSETCALEFSDGKILLGKMQPLIDCTIDDILLKIPEHELAELFDTSNVIAITNWTMMVNMSSIVEFFLQKIFPMVSKNRKIFFFDIADPEKRKRHELLEFLKIISRCEKYGRCILGLNVREAQQVLSVLGIVGDVVETKDSMCAASHAIQTTMGIDSVFIHGTKISAASSCGTNCATSGYFVQSPKISTGAGDHYNAGFLEAFLNGHDCEYAVNFAAAASAFYVENAVSPNMSDVENAVKCRGYLSHSKG